MQLSVLDNDLMMVLLKEEGVRPVRIISQVGSRVPVNWAAAGRLLVSDLDDKALTALLRRNGAAVADRTRRDRRRRSWSRRYASSVARVMRPN